MPQPHNILIHEFSPTGLAHFDDEGDQMLGFYFQITDKDDEPISEMIGPYVHKWLVEPAARKAFDNRDF